MDPLFVAMAVNVTFVPPQIVLPGFAEILTDGATVGVIFIKMLPDVAVVGLAQSSDDVITTLTSSSFANVLFE